MAVEQNGEVEDQIGRLADQALAVDRSDNCLDRFLAYWRREIEAVLHSVQVAHKHLIGPAEWRAIDGVITIN